MDGKPTIMLSANNYLNRQPIRSCRHPSQLQGNTAGSGSVRAIAGTMDIHLEAERKVAEFKGVESALIFRLHCERGTDSFTGSRERGHNHLDELNRFVIDGVRLTKTKRAVFPTNDMGALEQVLKENDDSERKLIIVDGVFSMDGDICPLDELTASEEHNAMVMVDDCHGEGVLGDGGRVSLTTSNYKVG